MMKKAIIKFRDFPLILSEMVNKQAQYRIYYQNKADTSNKVIVITLSQMKRNSIRQKENVPYMCEPRPSLRMTMTAKKNTQKQSGRMSVLPLRRQRLSVNIQPQQLTQSRPSLRTNINLMNTISTTTLHSCQRSIRKQTIINNLVNKLDQQQEIRSIIETKLKRNSYGPNKQFMYTSEFQPYSSNSSSLQVSQKNLTQQLVGLMESNNNGGTNRGDFISRGDNEESAVTVLSLKLRQTQDELDYFKSIVGEITKKMKQMEREQANSISSKVSNYGSTIKGERRDSFAQRNLNCQQNYTSTNINSSRCVNCCHCKCNSGEGNSFSKGNNGSDKLVDVNTQTNFEDNSITYQAQKTSNYEFDFFDNLDRTLKILSNSKNL